MTLTENEKKVVAQFGNFLNYDTLEANLEDNATFFKADEIEGFTNRRSLGGVLSSLAKKGLVSYGDWSGEDCKKFFLVTDEGLKAYYKLHN